MSSQSILLVDDDDVFRGRLATALLKLGMEVAQANSASNALELAQANPPDLALVDLRMPGESGLTLVGDLLKVRPSTRIVVLTGYGSIATAVEAMRLGATHYLAKPADVNEILSAFAETPAEHDGQAPSAPTPARTEWEHINRVLADCDGNISEAARRLGLHRRSLQRKLQKYPPKQ